MAKTIKELADELGVSKDKVRYQVRKLPTNYIGKLPSGIITIKPSGVRLISERLGKHTAEISGNFTHFFTHLEKQIEQQQQQIEHLQKLLENQQVLTLQAQEQIKLLSSEKEQIKLDVSERKSKWKFWR